MRQSADPENMPPFHFITVAHTHCEVRRPVSDAGRELSLASRGVRGSRCGGTRTLLAGEALDRVFIVLRPCSVKVQSAEMPRPWSLSPTHGGGLLALVYPRTGGAL